MVSHGRPLRSITAIGDPSSTADALPTPRKRNAQCTSDAPVPGQIIGTAQAREIMFDVFAAALATQLQQRTQQALEIALTPARGRNTQHPTVEIDQPAVATGIEQDVVGVEIGVIQPGAVEAGNQPPRLFPRRATP